MGEIVAEKNATEKKLRAFKIVKGRGKFSHGGVTYSLGDTVTTTSDLKNTGFGERFEEVEVDPQAVAPQEPAKPQEPAEDTVDVPSQVKKLLPKGSSVISRDGKVILRATDGSEQEFESVDAMANALV
jgi:hypothetical protein